MLKTPRPARWTACLRLASRMALPLLFLGGMASCAETRPVVQGKVLSVDQGGAVVRVADETKPEGDALAIDISKAEIGNPPQPGDVVRIVYESKGGANLALRVMNLTRQKEKGEG